MVQKQRSEYLDFRRKFEPSSARLVIVAESPPEGGKYFYNPSGKVSEPLFTALIRATLHPANQKKSVIV